jgi:F0F1-type ATP synthase membrane subunit b/b'
MTETNVQATAPESLEAIKRIHAVEQEAARLLASLQADVAARIQRLKEETEAAVAASRHEAEEERARKLVAARRAIEAEVARILDEGRARADAVRASTEAEIQKIEGALYDSIFCGLGEGLSGA